MVVLRERVRGLNLCGSVGPRPVGAKNKDSNVPAGKHVVAGQGVTGMRNQ